MSEVFKESLLNGLNSDDRELIRVLSYKDKNIAKLLEDKHNKVIFLSKVLFRWLT
jgi:hypothetical protein